MNPGETKAPVTLAERFWSLARGMEKADDSTDPVVVVEHVLAVLSALESGAVGRELSANTINFLTLLRQYEIKGDLLYASPEQARGEQVDERSLVFSVGVLLFEKLTGRHPFGAEGNPQRLARIRRGEMASGVNYFPRVPTGLRVVLVRAMGPFPEERWGSLAELRAELEVFLVRARDPANRSGIIPVKSRPLPALPGDTQPPELGARRRPSTSSPAASTVDLERMATMSGRHSAIRADEIEPPTTIARPRLQRPTTRPRLPPGAWALAGVLVGVLVTTIVFLAAWPSRESRVAVSEPAPVPAAGARQPAARVPAPAAGAPAPVPAAGARQPAAGAPAPAAVAPARPSSAPAAAPAASPTAARPPSPAAAPEVRPAPRMPPPRVGSGSFDPEVGASAALAAVRTCMAADRKAQFGASLLYDAESGLSRKVYFGAVQQLNEDERTCLEQKLLDLAAGGRPPQSTIVTYSFHVSPTGDQVKARVRPTP